MEVEGALRLRRFKEGIGEGRGERLEGLHFGYTFHQSECCQCAQFVMLRISVQCTCVTRLKVRLAPLRIRCSCKITAIKLQHVPSWSASICDGPSHLSHYKCQETHSVTHKVPPSLCLTMQLSQRA